MARLFPKIDPKDIANSGERNVAKALLEQLPRRVEVFHGFNWLARTATDTFQEGECDFILIEPENGLLFVEVKGGTLVFDGTRWVRQVGTQQRELNKDPFEQAQRAMHDIVEIVEKRFAARAVRFTYGYAVAFPDCRFTGHTPANMKPELILDADKLRAVPKAIRNIFARFARRDHRAMDTTEVESVRAALFPKYQLVPVLWRRVEDQEERLRRLTEDQQRLLGFLAQRPLAAVSGVAGSGKTLLALAKAQAMAREGLRTLFLCYNQPLRDWIRQAVPASFEDRLVIDNFHGLAGRLCHAAGVPLWQKGDPNDQAFWREVAPEALMEACERLDLEHKFEAVVVDEGQDFRELWWVSIDGLFRDPAQKRCFYVFYDPRQNLYVNRPELPPELGPPYDLPQNCRNTVRIAAHCAALVGYEHKVREDAPLGDEPEIERTATVTQALMVAGKRVRALCMSNQGGLKKSQVAVLAPSATQNQWPDSLGPVPLTRDLEAWQRGDGVLIDTWGRFKGLEADAIVLIETPMPNTAWETTNRYVARSRAKHLLTIIEVEGT